jgi:hypothetical protein
MLRELLKACVRDPLLPVVRGYIRHFPVDAGKRAVWSRIGRRFEHVPHAFVVRTRFGARTRLVNIDVEGAEWLVVAGMRSLPSTGPRDLEVGVSNDYRFSHNLPPRTVTLPRRIRGPVEEQTDVVFSRVDAEEL